MVLGLRRINRKSAVRDGGDRHRGGVTGNRGGVLQRVQDRQALADQARQDLIDALGAVEHGQVGVGQAAGGRLDQVIETARRFYPSSLTETAAVTLAGGPGRAG